MRSLFLLAILALSFCAATATPCAQCPTLYETCVARCAGKDCLLDCPVLLQSCVSSCSNGVEEVAVPTAELPIKAMLKVATISFDDPMQKYEQCKAGCPAKQDKCTNECTTKVGAGPNYAARLQACKSDCIMKEIDCEVQCAKEAGGKCADENRTNWPACDQCNLDCGRRALCLPSADCTHCVCSDAVIGNHTKPVGPTQTVEPACGGCAKNCNAAYTNCTTSCGNYNGICPECNAELQQCLSHCPTPAKVKPAVAFDHGTGDCLANCNESYISCQFKGSSGCLADHQTCAAACPNQSTPVASPAAKCEMACEQAFTSCATSCGSYNGLCPECNKAYQQCIQKCPADTTPALAKVTPPFAAVNGPRTNACSSAAMSCQSSCCNYDYECLPGCNAAYAQCENAYVVPPMKASIPIVSNVHKVDLPTCLQGCVVTYQSCATSCNPADAQCLGNCGVALATCEKNCQSQPPMTSVAADVPIQKHAVLEEDPCKFWCLRNYSDCMGSDTGVTGECMQHWETCNNACNADRGDCLHMCQMYYTDCWAACQEPGADGCRAQCASAQQTCVTKCPAKNSTLVTLAEVKPAVAFSQLGCIDQCRLDNQQCIANCRDNEECTWYCQNPLNACIANCPAPGPIKLAAQAPATSCADRCTADYNDCNSGCGNYNGICKYCTTNYQQCIAKCPAKQTVNVPTVTPAIAATLCAQCPSVYQSCLGHCTQSPSCMMNCATSLRSCVQGCSNAVQEVTVPKVELPIQSTSGTSCADQCNTAFQSCFNECGGYNDWNCLGGCQVVVDKCLTQCPAKQPTTLPKVTLAAFSTPNCLDACDDANQQCINDCGEDEPCQWRCEMPYQQCLVKCPAPGPIKLAAKANAPAKATAVATASLNSCEDQCSTAFSSCTGKCGDYNYNCLSSCNAAFYNCDQKCQSPKKSPVTGKQLIAGRKNQTKHQNKH